MTFEGEETQSKTPTMEDVGKQSQADLKASVNSTTALNPSPLPPRRQSPSPPKTPLPPPRQPPSPPKTLNKTLTTPTFNKPLNSPLLPPPTITTAITSRTVPAASPLPLVLNVYNNEQNYVSNHIDHEYFDSFPPGYRFCPLDEELVVHYLKNKVTDQPLPRNKIMEVNLYHYNPESLAARYKQHGEKEWYFFTPRDKKYRNGSRPNRAAGDGYWKATGADKQVKYKGAIVGFRKALVFYKGKPPRGDKTNWIMHEYRVNDAPRSKRGANDMRLDDWVLCRIYEKVEKPKIRNQPRVEEGGPALTIHNDANVLPGIDCDSNSVNSTGYLGTFRDDSVVLPNEFCQFPRVNNFPINNNLDNFPIDNFDVRFNDQYQALSSNSGTYGEPVYPRNVSWGMRPPRLQDDVWNVTNFGDSDIAMPLVYNGTYIEGFDSVDNLFAIDSSTPVSNLPSNPTSSLPNSGSNLPSNPPSSFPHSTTCGSNLTSNSPLPN